MVLVMTINSKRKGKSGELQIAHICQQQGFPGAHRTNQFCGATGEAGDVEGLPNIHIEVKYREHLNLYEAMEQSIRDATANGEGKMPTVFHRKNQKPWMVTVGIDDWFKLYKAWLKEKQNGNNE